MHLYQSDERIDGWVNVNPAMDLCVYAYKVTVHGKIKLTTDFDTNNGKGPVKVKSVGNLKIIARHLAAEDVPNFPATLDITPDAMPPPGTFTEEVQEGGKTVQKTVTWFGTSPQEPSNVVLPPKDLNLATTTIKLFDGDKFQDVAVSYLPGKRGGDGATGHTGLKAPMPARLRL